MFTEYSLNVHSRAVSPEEYQFLLDLGHDMHPSGLCEANHGSNSNTQYAAPVAPPTATGETENTLQ